jgi:hypothetical protein
MSNQRTPERPAVPEDPIALARMQANRFAVDYRTQAQRLGTPVVPIIDAHCHINGPAAAKVMLDAMDTFGVERVYSQTQMPAHEAVQEAMGDRARFLAVPTYGSDDLGHAMRQGLLDQLPEWHARGARCLKLWTAPRLRDYADNAGFDADEIATLEGPWRRRVMDKASELGMMLMVHIADPDTWFATNYADSSRYGTKRDQYAPFERMLDVYKQPWMAAHMGGWPEDLAFLTGLLERHSNLILDTSATKWMVRELSKHPRDAFVGFLERFAGRILFGSDIVASDEHLEATDPDSPRFGATLAASRADAFDLYASRYWALRTMYETDYRGESNIADPDLAMVEPDKYDALSAPQLIGRHLPEGLLKVLYRGAAEQTLDAWYERDGS